MADQVARATAFNDNRKRLKAERLVREGKSRTKRQWMGAEFLECGYTKVSLMALRPFEPSTAGLPLRDCNVAVQL
jgi:hypothetical protein